MTPERWSQIQQQLNVALSLSIAERVPFLESLGTTDVELQREVESLLLGEKADPEFLSTPAFGLLRNSFAQSLPSAMVGRMLGAYRVTELLGAGGMGEVYRAIRVDGQYDQQVAVKIVRPGLSAEFSSARFRNERQILATLDHPNIAKILDGGTTDDGISYFVMELVDGVAITEYCDKNRLSIKERFRLFQTVCSAVHYAHQHLIVHRDIKPTNVLVTENGTPKLLDFGIAKVLGPDPAQSATQTGLLMMTPEYASPEQLRGELITTATDQYSLGVILYELLTGCHPFRARGEMPHEIARGVLEMEAEKPSSAARRKEREQSRQQGNSAPAPDVDTASTGKLSRILRGDADSIVLKTLRKDPRDRYGSVDQLSEDIRRHLEGLPVFARKGTLSYRASKYVLRHKAGVAGVLIVFLTLVVGIVLTVREARIAHRNELRAERRFNDVQKLANSLLFEIHDSVKDLPGSTPARKLIIQNALLYLDDLTSEAAGDPSLQRQLATAYERIGEVQGDYVLSNLGQTETALQNYQKALALRQSLAASKSATWQDQLALAKSYRLVAAQIRVTGNIPAALQDAQEAISIGEALRVAHPQDKEVLAELRTAYERKGHIERGSWTQAAPGDISTALGSFRKAMEVDAALLKLDPGNQDYQYEAGRDEMYYAEVLPHSRDDERLQHFQHVLEINQKINDQSPSLQHARGVAENFNRIAMWYNGRRDHVKSAEYHRRYLEIIEPLYAADPQNTLLKEEVVIGSANLGAEVGFLGDKEESRRLLDRAVTLMQSIAQAAPENTSHQGSLAAALIIRGDNFVYEKNFKPGLADYEATIEIYRRLLAKNPGNSSAQKRLLISRISVAHTKLQMGSLQAHADLQSVLGDLKPLLEGNTADDDMLYSAAVIYADLGRIEFAAARDLSAGRKSHLESATQSYRSSLSTLKRVQDLPAQSESESLGTLDPANVSKQLAICESALSHITSSSQHTQ